MTDETKQPQGQRSKDDVTGPWWVSFEAMLTPKQQDALGVSEDRGATQCIVRLISALLWPTPEVAAAFSEAPSVEPQSAFEEAEKCPHGLPANYPDCCYPASDPIHAPREEPLAAPRSGEKGDMLPESIASALVDEWERISEVTMHSGHRSTMERLIAQLVRDRVGYDAAGSGEKGDDGHDALSCPPHCRLESHRSAGSGEGRELEQIAKRLLVYIDAPNNSYNTLAYWATVEELRRALRQGDVEGKA